MKSKRTSPFEGEPGEADKVRADNLKKANDKKFKAKRDGRAATDRREYEAKYLSRYGVMPPKPWYEEDD